MDSSASGHIAADSQNIHQSQPSSSTIRIQEVQTRGGKPHAMKGTSTSIVKTSARKIKLTNVQYVPNMKKNLISAGSIIESGNIVVFSNLYYWILNKGNYHDIMVVEYCDPLNNLYCFGNDFKANIGNLAATKNVLINNCKTMAHKLWSFKLSRPFSSLEAKQSAWPSACKFFTYYLQKLSY